MRFFVIAKSGSLEKVGIVFHDYVEGYVLCRAKKRSFYEAFNFAASRIRSVLVKSSGSNFIKIRSFGVNDYSWIDRVLFETCGSYWEISHEGKTSNRESSIDGVVREYLE